MASPSASSVGVDPLGTHLVGLPPKRMSPLTRFACKTISASLGDVVSAGPWNYICSIDDMRERMALLTNGCFYIPSDEALESLFRKIERPRPCCFIRVFEWSFFSTAGTCPSLLPGKQATSLGNLTVTGCNSGLLDAKGACIPAVELAHTGAPLNVTVFKLGGFLRLPSHWSKTDSGTTPGAPRSTPKTRRQTAVHQISAPSIGQPPLGTIPVHYYLCGGTDSPVLNIGLQALQDQTAVLNGGFAGTDTCALGKKWYTPQHFNMGITFAIGGVLTIEDEMCDLDCSGMAHILLQGALQQEYFKVKVLVCSGMDVLGFVTDYPSDSQNRALVILAGTMPGGEEVGFNLGKTLVHEMGHYLGLFHTFELRPSCILGDAVLDTNNENGPYFGCPSIGGGKRRTCDLSVDPIHNFMDYSNDACMCSFTFGQSARIGTELLFYQLDLWAITVVHLIISSIIPLLCC